MSIPGGSRRVKDKEWTKVRLVGLTGGIASGKSTVSQMLRALGATVIDADVLAREVVEPGTAGLAAVVAAFGTGVLDAHGALDRKRLGELVFADAEARARLEAIVHPLIFQRFQERTSKAAARGESVVIYDAALLFERGLDRLMNETVVVDLPRETQLARLMARDGIGRDAAEQRLAAQLPLAEKVTRATHVIDNSKDHAQTREQVQRLWRQLCRI